MAIDGQYVVAQSSRITYYSGRSTQATLKGLQGMSLPLGATGQSIEISVIGTRISTKVASGMSYDNISTSAYFMKNDPGQLYLMDANRNATLIQDMWFWIDATDFVAMDLVNDPSGGIMVQTFSSPQATKNEVYTSNVEFTVSGSHIFFTKHADASTAVFSTTAGGAGASATITSADTTNYGFVDDLGFAEGDIVIIHGLTGYLTTVYYGQIKTVTNSTITLEDAIGDEATLPTVSAASTIKIHGAVPFEVSDTF